jgi:hypothetical protein
MIQLSPANTAMGTDGHKEMSDEHPVQQLFSSIFQFSTALDEFLSPVSCQLKMSLVFLFIPP